MPVPVDGPRLHGSARRQRAASGAAQGLCNAFSRSEPDQRPEKPSQTNLRRCDTAASCPVPWRLHYGETLPRCARRISAGRARRMRRSSRCSAAFPRIAWSERGNEGWWTEIVGPGLGVDTPLTGCSAWIISAAAAKAPGRRPAANFRRRAPAIRRDALCGHRAALGIDRCMPSSAHPTAAWWRCASRSATPSAWAHRGVERADKSQVLSTAWRSVQRQIVREAIARGDGASGLKLARALAMATYRSAVEFAAALRRGSGTRARPLSISDRGVSVRARR